MATSIEAEDGSPGLDFWQQGDHWWSFQEEWGKHWVWGIVGWCLNNNGYFIYNNILNAYHMPSPYALYIY